MTWRIRALTDADAGAVAELFRRSRQAAMPWLPVMHTPGEDGDFFGSEIATSLGWAATEDGTLLAFALARDGWLNHLYVDPGHRGRGVGTALLGNALAAMPEGAQLWVFERNQRARDFYATHGFVEAERTDGSGNEEREPDVRLTRSRRAPGPLVVRDAALDDADGIARVHTTTWQQAYRGLLDQGFLHLLDWRQRRTQWQALLAEPPRGEGGTVVAVLGEEVVGFAAYGPARDADLMAERRRWSELYAIYVSPDQWRTGTGTALWAAVAERLPPDAAAVAVWLLAGNQRARAFYARMGFAADGAERVEDIGGAPAEEVRYRNVRF